MPKKRNNSCSRNKKEKQILTARLIEISLKVEDYIYKHKSISECDAEQYIAEVTSYKSQCGRDERSLQVIEKLTRCMKAIIVDHQELRNDTCNINDDSVFPDNDIHSVSISPVYSICEEDRTQLTQIAEERARSVTEANKDVGIIDLTNIDDDDSIHNDAGNNTPTANNDSSRINVEVDIHRAISSLSIREVEDQLEIASTDANFSQSILNNFEGIDMPQNTTNVTSQGAIYGPFSSADKVKSTIVCTKIDKKIGNFSSICRIQHNKPALKSDQDKTSKLISINAPNIPYTKEKTVVQNIEPMKVINATNYNVTNAYIQKDTTKTSNAFYPASNKGLETQTQTWYDSNRTCTINNSSHVLKDTINLTPAAQFNKVVNSNHTTVNNSVSVDINIPKNNLNEVQIERHETNASEPSQQFNNDKPKNITAIVNENSTTIKKKRAPRKKKTVEENEMKPTNKRIYRTPKRTDKNVPIYNKNVENDLSWIENIRYVREIREDENDSNLNLAESFWNNYYLPANWSENDFL